MLGWWTANHSAKPIWGDGFFDDTVGDVFSAIDANLFVPDELFRYLPGLARGDKGLISREIRRICGIQIDDLTSRMIGPPTDLVEEGRIGVERILKTGDWPPFLFRERDAALIAFVSGVHPAFIWEEALISHDRFASFAWLGHAVRSRRAYLPLEVAIYFSEVFVDDGERTSCVDPLLAELVPLQADVRQLRRCAEWRKTSSVAVFTRKSRGLSKYILRRQRR